MIAAELISPQIPILRLTDRIQQALDWMQEHHVAELALAADGKFLGLLHAADLQDAPDAHATVESLLPLTEKIAVSQQIFILHALQQMQLRRLSVLPVISEAEELLGVITTSSMLNHLAKYTGAGEPGGIILLQMRPNDFSISEIGRIIESSDARIIHVATWTDETGYLLVAIKVNKTDILDILASFERYEYHVLSYFGENLSEEELKTNYDHLMNYLNI